MNVRLPEDLHERMKESAKENRRSLNSEIIVALEEYLEHSKPMPPQASTVAPLKKK